MRDAHLYKYYTMAGLLDKLDVIECFESQNKKLKVGEVIDKQRKLYVALGIEPPTSLWVAPGIQVVTKGEAE